MFPKDYRLSARNIGFLYKKGQRVKIGSLFFVYNAITHQEHGHFAVVVSKKYSSLAVVRNKQKRIIRSAIHNAFIDAEVKCDFIVTYTEKGKMLSYKEVNDCLMRFKTHILNDLN